jgi:hypothetical protein
MWKIVAKLISLAKFCIVLPTGVTEAPADQAAQFALAFLALHVGELDWRQDSPSTTAAAYSTATTIYYAASLPRQSVVVVLPPRRLPSFS